MDVLAVHVLDGGRDVGDTDLTELVVHRLVLELALLTGLAPNALFGNELELGRRSEVGVVLQLLRLVVGDVVLG